MSHTVISDTRCLISLHNSGDLILLQAVFGEVITTETIAEEYGLPLPEWIVVRPNIKEIPDSFAGFELDAGEASAITRAEELGNALLILDDLKARRVAEMLGIKIIGTLGVGVEAKRRGIIPSIRPLLQRLRTAGLRFSPEVELLALKQAGEVEGG